MARSELIFGEIAVQRGWVRSDQLERALRALEASGSTSRIGNYLVEAGLLTEAQVVEILREQRTYSRRAAKHETGRHVRLGAPAAHRDPHVGRQVSGFNLVDVIERDSQLGVTYRAWDREADQAATVLVVPIPPGTTDRLLVDTIEAIRPAAAVEHPGLESVLEVGVWGPRLYLASASSSGESTAELLGRRGQIEPRFGAWMIGQVALGLAHAHGGGVIHGAIEARSLTVDQGGQPKLCGFGRAALRELLDHGTSLPDRPAAATLSPELMTGKTPDARADLYALGVVAFELLTGSPPYRERRRRELVAKLREQRAVPRIDAVDGVPERLAEIVARLMAPQPDDRYQTAEELLDDSMAFFARAFPRTERKGTGEGPAPGPATPGFEPAGDPALDGSAGPTMLADAAAVVRELRADRERRPELDGEEAETRRQLAVGLCVRRNLSEEAPEAIQDVMESMGDEAVDVVVASLRRLREQDRAAEMVALGFEAISFFPGQTALHYLTGVALSIEDDHQRAWSQFKRVLHIDPDRPRAWVRLAEAEVKRGNPAAAEAAFCEAIRRSPEMADGHARYGNFLHRVRADLTGAVHHLGRATELAPDRGDLRTRLAWALFEKGESDQAAAELQRVVEIAPSAEVWVMLGRIKLDQSDGDAARACFETALELDDDCDEAKGGLLIHAYDGEDWARALVYARPLLECHPADTGVRLMLAVSLYKLGKLGASKRQFQAILDLDPHSADARHGLRTVREAIARAGGAHDSTDRGGTGATPTRGLDSPRPDPADRVDRVDEDDDEDSIDEDDTAVREAAGDDFGVPA